LEKEERRKKPDCSYQERFTLWGQIILSSKPSTVALNKALVDLNAVKTQLEGKLALQNQIIESKKPDFCALLIEQAKAKLEHYLKKTCAQYVHKLEQELEEIEPTLKEIKTKEKEKSRYQTQGFPKISQLLAYEASLLDEEEEIRNLSVH
jgi:hypothetical protein